MIMKDWRCFAEDYVLYVGETIGIVVGPDRATLKDLRDQIKIDYTEQTPAVTIDDGINSVGGPMFPEKGSNVMCELFCEKGRPMEEVFAEADEIFEETLTTPYQEHAHLETNSVLDIIAEKRSKCKCFFAKPPAFFALSADVRTGSASCAACATRKAARRPESGRLRCA